MLRALRIAVVIALATGSSRAEVRAVSQDEIDAAITRGVAHLLELYQDGEGRDMGSLPDTSLALVDRPGLRALTVYALLKSGVDPGNAVVEKLVRRLSFEPITGTYDAACMLLALVALDPVGQRTWIEELAHGLVARREKAGDFGYPGGGDLSNSQFAAFALRAAISAGVAVPPEVWTELSEAVLRYQTKDGGFGYMVSTRQSSRTMTAAGVGVLAIAEIELGRCGRLDTESAQRLRRARADGLEWLARQREYGRDDDHEAWHHYFLYGVERVGALCALDRIGAHDWYREGAAFLVAHQDDHGDWPGTFERAPTLFALLFLSRASAIGAATISARSPRTGPLPRPFPHTKHSDIVGGMRLDVEGRRVLRLSISRIASPANAAYEWPSEHGRGPHVALVEFLADGAPIEVVLGDAQRPVEERRIQCEHRGLARGSHRVAARVHVCPLPGEAGECVLETNSVEVEIEEDTPVAASEPAFDSELDLVLKAGPRVKASSVRPGSEDLLFAERASVDGNPRAPWIAAAGDERPSLEIHFTEPERANIVRIAPARLAPRSPDFLTLPREISIAVNGGAPRMLTMSDSSRTWFDVELERPELVRRLEIRLIGRDVSGASVGIGEVVLLRVPD